MTANSNSALAAKPMKVEAQGHGYGSNLQQAKDAENSEKLKKVLERQFVEIEQEKSAALSSL